MKIVLLGEGSGAKNRNGMLFDIFAGKKRSRFNPHANSDVPIKADGRDEELKLIPWREIKTAVSMARIRGHTGIVDTFFQVLVDQSLFDDQGAWCGPSQASPRHSKGKIAA